MKYTEEELIESLQGVYKETGRLPTQRDMGGNKPSVSTYITKFGSWSNAVKQLDITKKDILITKLVNLANELGRTPKKEEVTKNRNMPSATTYRNNFGSWNKALQAANLELYRQTELSKEDALNILRDLYKTKGKPLILSDLVKGVPSASYYESNFGSWSNALKKAGIPEYCKASYVSEKNLGLSYNKEWLLEQNKTKSLSQISKDLGFKGHTVISNRFKELNITPNKQLFASQPEKDLLATIQEFYSGEILTSQRVLPNNREIDIYLPSENLGIEFNGLYWHSEASGKHKNYHLQKTQEAAKLGIRLIHIFENEWEYKKDIVISRLKNLLGISSRIYARKCTIRELEVSEAKVFFNTNHIQGYTGASVKLGLYYQEELVASMTFGKSRFSNTEEWELIRYANKLNFSVVGGASKLFKYFLRNYTPNSIISYSDKRWNTGNLYTQLGFKHTHDSTPNYWYFKGLKLESRIKYQKYKLPKVLEEFEPKWTEVANMEYNGYNRIFDCGNSVYKWTS